MSFSKKLSNHVLSTNELSDYLKNVISEEKQKWIDLHDLLKAMQYLDYFTIIIQYLPRLVKGSKECTSLAFDSLIKQMSTNLSLFDNGMQCISQFSLDKENKLILKRFISSHLSQFTNDQIVLAFDCLLSMIDSKVDINLLSLLFSLFSIIQFQSYSSYLEKWSIIFTSKKFLREQVYKEIESITLQPSLLPFLLYYSIHYPSFQFQEVLQQKLQTNEISWNIIEDCISKDCFSVYELLYCIFLKAFIEIKQNYSSLSKWCNQHEVLLISNIAYKEYWFSLACQVIQKQPAIFISLFTDSCILKEDSEKNQVFTLFLCELLIHLLPSYSTILQSILSLLYNQFYLLSPLHIIILCNAICHYCKDEILQDLFSLFSSHYDIHSILLSLSILYYSLSYQNSILIQHPSLNFLLQRSSFIKDIHIQLMRSRCLFILHKNIPSPWIMITNHYMNLNTFLQYIQEHPNDIELVAEMIAYTALTYEVSITPSFFESTYDLKQVQSFIYCIFTKLATIQSSYIPFLFTLQNDQPIGLLPLSTFQSCLQQSTSFSFLLHTIQANPSLCSFCLKNTTLLSSLLSNEGNSESIAILQFILEECKYQPSLLSSSLVESIYLFCANTLVKEHDVHTRINLLRCESCLMKYYAYPCKEIQQSCFIQEILNTLQHIDLFGQDEDYPIASEFSLFYDKHDICHNALFLLSLLPLPSSFSSFVELKQLADSSVSSTQTKDSSFHEKGFDDSSNVQDVQDVQDTPGLSDSPNTPDMDVKRRRRMAFDKMIKQIEEMASQTKTPTIQTFPFLSNTNIIHFIEYCIVLCCMHAIQFNEKKKSLDWIHEILYLLKEQNSVLFLQFLKEDSIIRHTISTILHTCTMILEHASKDYKEYAESIDHLVISIKEMKEICNFIKKEISITKLNRSIQSMELAISSISCIYGLSVFIVCFNIFNSLFSFVFSFFATIFLSAN